MAERRSLPRIPRADVAEFPYETVQRLARSHAEQLRRDAAREALVREARRVPRSARLAAVLRLPSAFGRNVGGLTAYRPVG